MKQRILSRLTLVVVFFALAGYFLFQNPSMRLPRGREVTVQTATCSIPVLELIEHQGGGNSDSAIVFHGLTANKTMMRTLGLSLLSYEGRVFLVDLPGHGNNREPFTFERAETCAGELLATLEQRGDIALDRTVLVGHSMGAGIAIRLADLYPTAATISVSTAMRQPLPGKPSHMVPLDLPRRMPVNLLLVTGAYDLPMAKEAALRILRAAEGQRSSARDFAERRAVRWVNVPYATHTSLIVDGRVLRLADQWARQALPGGSLYHRGPNTLFLAGLSGLAGLILLFPYAAGALHRAFGKPTSGVDFLSKTTSIVPLVWAGAALVAVGLQYKWVPLSPLVRMYSGDYLASVLMIAGVVLLISRRRWAQHAAPLQTNWDWRAVGMAAALGILTMLAFGAWLNWHITDAWLNAPRWWRFALLVPLVLPYFLAEEIALGAPQAKNPWRARAGRFLLFLVLRGLLWLAMIFGLVLLQSGEVLMALLVIYMAAFSIGQRMGMDAVRRRTGSAAAAAVFGAILAAWFIAAVFPIT